MPDSSLLPADVQAFVRQHVASVPALEALLLLYRQRGAGLTAAEVARQLYLTPAQTSEVLERLHAAGLVGLDAARAGAFRFERGADPARDALVRRVARCHEQHLVAMTRLIHESAHRSPRQPPV